MRTKYLLILLLAIAASCNNSGNANNAETNEATFDTLPDGTVQTVDGKPVAQNWEKLTMVPFYDNQGQVIAEAPYPSGWDLKKTAKKGEPSITGPNGVKIMDQSSHSYIYTNDPRMQQIYYQSGQQVRAWPGAEQLIQDDFVPELTNQGWTFVKSYEIPEVSKTDKWYNDQLFKAVPMRTQVEAWGSEWKNAAGEPAFMITHVQVSNSADLQTWYYYSAVLKADKEYFEKARKQYIFSLANTRYALEPIAEYNKSEAQKAGQSWAAFNQRMAQNQAAFEQQQRNHVNKSNAINESIMKGWNDRNASSDRQQEQFVDVINEKTNTIDPSTGKQYKVESHYNNYWMNSNGEYISTNQNDYNPNLDDGVNNQNWQKLEKRDD
jgi:hypothetical protein